MSKSLWKNVDLVLYSLIIFFTVFDGVRDHFAYQKYLSVIRDLSIAVLFIKILLINRWHFKRTTFDPLLILFGAIACISIPVNCLITPYVLNSHRSFVRTYYPFFEWVLFFRFIEFFILIYLYSYFEKLTGKSLSFLFKQILGFEVLYVIFNLLAYFAPLPLFQYRPWWGRVSEGYPTMDAQVLCYALLSLLFIVKTSKIKFVFLFVVIVVGVLMQATSTGFISLTFIGFYAFLFNKKLLVKKSVIVFILTIISLLIFIGYQLLNKYFSGLLGQYIYQLTFKVNEAFFQNQPEARQV